MLVESSSATSTGSGTMIMPKLKKSAAQSLGVCRMVAVVTVMAAGLSLAL